MFACNTKLFRSWFATSKWQHDFQPWTMSRFPGPWHPSSPRQTQHSASCLKHFSGSTLTLAQFLKETKPPEHDLYLSLSSFLSTPEPIDWFSPHETEDWKPQRSIFPMDSVQTGGKVFTEPFWKTAFSASTKERAEKTLVFPIACQPLDNQAVSARPQL